MKFENFIKKLNTALQQELPGYEAQRLMEPSIRKQQIEKMKAGNDAIECSVLILLYPKNNKIFTVFIKRPKYDGVHSEQIAFPGGQYEKNDGSLFITALRESKEEIGIDPHDIEIIGNLSDLFIPPSNFNVLPVVAYMNKTPVFDIDKNEVDKIIEISLDDLLDKNIICKKEVLTNENTKLNVPCYFYEEHIIWGATAMVISELVEVIASGVKI